MIGLATLENEGGASKAWIDAGGVEVQIVGRMYPSDVQLQPFYDPKDEIMRS